MEQTNTNSATFLSVGTFRSAAREALKGTWGNAALCTLLYAVVSGVASYIPLGGIFVSGVLSFGFSVAMLHHMRGVSPDNLTTRPFNAFNNYGRYLGGSFLRSLYTSLWTLLLIIPGIIMAYAYAMTPYILHDQPELSPHQCIVRSKEMMRGYKWKLFCLDLSFIGWLLLCVITLGILSFWVHPYMECARARFYEELKKQNATVIE
ncbi:MAG: DUF975 family protein [Bacteroidales bacterium]|nr:DUF975 family protein [Bacteroidales bacterium]